MIENLVFSGGGLKCICYIGVLKYLEEVNLKNIKEVVATSGGAIFGLYLKFIAVLKNIKLPTYLLLQ